MGHDEHFLTRLDRVPRDHVDLALTLYRDAGLVKLLLNDARVPSGAERVAISLAHPTRGPFLIVARDGHFVTCLGEGMSPAPHPVLARERLEVLTARWATIQDRLALARKLAGDEEPENFVFVRLRKAAHQLSREEFLALSAWQPLFAPEFFRVSLQLGVEIGRLHKSLHSIRHLRDADAILLEAWWRGTWMLANLVVLAAMGEVDYYDKLPPTTEWAGARCTALCANTRISGLLLRGTWAAARLGKRVLAMYKQVFSTNDNALETYESSLALLALGCRREALRPELLKWMDRPQPAQDAPVLERYRWTMLQRAKFVLDDLPKWTDVASRHGASLLARRLGPRGAPEFASEEAVPAELRPAALAASMGDPFEHDSREQDFATWAQPLVARAAPEELYFPQDLVPHVLPPTPSPERLLEYVRRASWGDPRKPAATARAAEGPARNDPCPCGSGKKFKKCCGR